MSGSRWERLAPLTGAVFFVLLAVGVALVGLVGGGFPPSSTAIVEFLENGTFRIQVGLYLSWVAVAFLLWFVGSLRSSLRIVEGGSGRLSAVAFGGGVAAAAAMVAGFAAWGGAAARAGSTEGISPDTAAALHDVYGNLVGVAAPIGFAVLVGATAVVSFRTRVFPAWFVWVSAIVALGLISPLLYVFVSLAFVWVLVISIWLYVRGRAPADEAQPAT